MTQSEDTIMAKMPFDSLTKIQGESDYHQLHRACMQLYQNLAAIYCTWGHGKGHLGAAMPDALFFQLYGEHYVTPVRPGPFDPTILNNMTAIVKARRTAAWEEFKLDYKKYDTVINIAKTQWIAAVPEEILSEIWDDYSGLNDVALEDIITHCFQREGIINDTMVTDNLDQMQQKEFDGEEGVGKYIKYMEERQRFASTAGELITDRTLIRNGTKAVASHPQFRDDWKKWSSLPPADRATWVQWKNFWIKAIADQKEFLRLTAGEMDLANAMERKQSGLPDPVIAGLIDNLANAATTDKSALTTLLDTNASLVAQIKQKDTIIHHEKDKLITTLQNKLGQQGGVVAVVVAEETTQQTAIERPTMIRMDTVGPMDSEWERRTLVPTVVAPKRAIRLALLATIAWGASCTMLIMAQH